ncbi:hypothetical protein WMY93_007926 [Mugilogobius chulae]|uniref:Ribosomal protein eL8/eL30/eS12/Gadd45 domain-containing protein n=1 Tax=Mugilogobius chulae TaxID=88201 RepID=A0AAW0PEF0_9GOBI
MTKAKKEKAAEAEEESAPVEKSYQELIANVNPIAQPLASKKLCKKLYKCVKKGENAGKPHVYKQTEPCRDLYVSVRHVLARSVQSGFSLCSSLFGLGLALVQSRFGLGLASASKVKQIRRGVKEVQKFINKGEKGACWLSGESGRFPVGRVTFGPVASVVEKRERETRQRERNRGLAGDTLPIDVYCHLPVMCEDRSLPYAYIPSKLDLGSSAGSKRPTCVILIKPHEDYQDQYDQVLEEVSALPKPL